MKREAWGNPKLRRLARRFGGDYHKAAGVLEALWCFAARFAPAGDVGRWSDEDIAEGMHWRPEDGTPEELIEALVPDWLDRDPVHRLLVHDWEEHADSAVRRALQRADAKERGIKEKDGVPQWAKPCRDTVTTESGQCQTQLEVVGDPPDPEPRQSPARASVAPAGAPGGVGNGSSRPRGKEPPAWALRAADRMRDLLADVRGSPKSPDVRAWARWIARIPAAYGASEAEVELGIEWVLAPEQIENEYVPEVRSARTLHEKWPRIAAAAHRSEGKRRPEKGEVFAAVMERAYGPAWRDRLGPQWRGVA